MVIAYFYCLSSFLKKETVKPQPCFLKLYISLPPSVFAEKQQWNSFCFSEPDSWCHVTAVMTKFITNRAPMLPCWAAIVMWSEDHCSVVSFSHFCCFMFTASAPSEVSDGSGWLLPHVMLCNSITGVYLPEPVNPERQIAKENEKGKIVTRVVFV